MFLMATLIHNAQVFPETFFTAKNIEIIKKELEMQNISLNKLRSTISFFNNFPNKPKCKKLKPFVDYAIKLWRINENIEEDFYFDRIEIIDYVDCD